MSKEKKILMGIFGVLILLIVIMIIALFSMNNDNKASNSNVTSNKEDLKELPKPEITGGVRGELGIDKNINESNIDDYLNRSDAVYRDMRMLEDPGNYEAIGGDRYLSGYVKGFEIVPLPYLMPVEGLPEEVGDTYKGITLFSYKDGKYIANYEESISILEDLFPKDKVIFLMCGGGGYAGMTKNLLVSLGWNEDKIYNVGGYWYYEGKNNVEVKKEVDGKITYDFDKVPYHNIEFDKLTKIDRRIVVSSKKDEVYEVWNERIDKFDIHNYDGDDYEAYEQYVMTESKKIFKEKADYINQLMKDKKSFIITFNASEKFCSASIFLGPDSYMRDYAIKKKIYVYEANLAVLKNTEIYKTVKYTPTVVIIDKGEIVAYTDMNSDEHKIMYGGDPENNKENYDAFVKWLESYVKIG